MYQAPLKTTQLGQTDLNITLLGLGAWAIGNPDRSTLLLITIVGIYAVFHGTAELVAGFQYRQLRSELGLD